VNFDIKYDILCLVHKSPWRKIWVETKIIKYENRLAKKFDFKIEGLLS
jgi:hypothetical protein